MSIDVCIPTYKPDVAFLELLRKLETQTVDINRIIIINTEEKYFSPLEKNTEIFSKYGNIDVYHIKKEEFDHGNTRRMAADKSDADYLVFMTQDAQPKNDRVLENLMNAFKEDTAISYARQLPNSDCNEIEKFMRQFNYPARSRVKRLVDLKELGIKTYFCSNVCAAYDRRKYEQLGGFTSHTIFNEDMIYAAKAIQTGYSVVYMAEAEIIHSHNYTNMQQFHRNFDLGVSQAEHPEVFSNIPSEKEGIKSVDLTRKHLIQSEFKYLVPKLYLQSACKYIGYLLGKNYKKLPKAVVKAMSMNKEYWGF